MSHRSTIYRIDSLQPEASLFREALLQATQSLIEELDEWSTWTRAQSVALKGALQQAPDIKAMAQLLPEGALVEVTPGVWLFRESRSASPSAPYDCREEILTQAFKRYATPITWVEF